MRMYTALLLALFLLAPCGADDLYTTAEQAKLPPKIIEQLSQLKPLGITEVLVPTWFPSDLGLAQGKIDVSDPKSGPKIEITWPSSRSRLHSLVFRGTGEGLAGDGPDSTVSVDNPATGPIEMWVCIERPMGFRYGTGHGLTVPRGADKEYYLDLQTNGNSAAGLTSMEMQRILGSVRRLKL
jgi:hypothetical protein